MATARFHRRSVSELLDFSVLNNIRPLEEERGRCVACAGTTGQILKSDQKTNPEKVTERKAECDFLDPESFKNASIIEAPTAEKDPKQKAVTAFFEFFRAKEPGSIFFVNTEDHAYIIFKSFNNNLYLLDSDARYYCQLRTINDLSTPAGVVKADKPYHYFYESDEGSIFVYPMGKAHPSWKNNLKTPKDEKQKNITWFDDQKSNDLKILSQQSTKFSLFNYPKVNQHIVVFHPRNAMKKNSSR